MRLVDWRLKVGLQNALGLLPGRLPFQVNEWLTRGIQGAPLDAFDPDERFKKGIDNLKLLQSKTGFRIKNRNVLELGTGWLGIDLLLFHLAGARLIVTVDHHPHLRASTLCKLIEIASANRGQWTELIAGSGIADREVVERRMEKLVECRSQVPSTVTDLLMSMSVKNFIAPSCQTQGIQLPPRSIDLFYSESVLQRIPVGDLRRILHDIARRLMHPSGVIFHRINPMDINGHLDSRLWYFNYLKYSDLFFEIFYSGKLNSQNRLREPEFVELFNEIGFEIAYVGSYMKADDVEKLKHFPVNRRFANFTPEELAIFRSKIVGNLKSSRNESPAMPHREVFYTRGYAALD